MHLPDMFVGFMEHLGPSGTDRDLLLILMYFNPALAPGKDQPKTGVLRADRRQELMAAT
jgi:hypothetical protein